MKKILILTMIVLLMITGCNSKNTASDEVQITKEQAEMFTTDMTASFDSKYFAIMGASVEDDKTLAVVNIFSEMGDSVYSFTAGNIDNFFGVCWEKDTYNLWILTSDNDAVCYKYADNKWVLDNNESKLNI